MHENANVYFRASRADLIAIDGSALGTQTAAGIALTITRSLCISKEHPCSRHKEHWVRDVSCPVEATLVRVNIEKMKDIPYPLDMPRFMTITSLLFQACKTGIPEMEESGSSAMGLTVSLAPMTSVTSVSEKSSLISSISRTTCRGQKFHSIGARHDLLSYGTEASARRTLHCPGMRPATG